MHKGIKEFFKQRSSGKSANSKKVRFGQNKVGRALDKTEYDRSSVPRAVMNEELYRHMRELYSNRKYDSRAERSAMTKRLARQFSMVYSALPSKVTEEYDIPSPVSVGSPTGSPRRSRSLKSILRK